MISFSISLEDVGYPCFITSKGWRFNNSEILPFIHPALDIFAITDGTKYLFVVREHHTGELSDSKKGIAVRRVDAREISRVKKELTEWPLHYIAVLINMHTVTIRTGKWGVSPIYVVEKDDRLMGHWNSIELYKYLPSLELNKEMAAHFLVTHCRHYSKNTLFAGMFRLTERSMLQWKGKQTLKITYPPAIEQPFVKELKPGADVVGMFGDILSHSMSRWMTKDIQTIAAELSSGLDSGILSVIASSLAPGKVHTYGLLVMDEFREGQTERRNEFITRFGFKDTSLLAQDFLPFTINMTDAARRKTATWEECYHEAIYELLSAAGQNQDVLLFNGFGGDELFLPYLYEMSSKDRSDYTAEMHVTRKKAPSFIKDELYNAYADTMHSLKKAPKSLMIFSTVEAVAYSSAEYLSHNIWPVSPYCTPELIMFCRSLPRTWRKNRRVQREFLARCGCSRKITHPEKPENFGSVLTCGLQKAALKINALFKKSYLADLGYIDAELFTAAYNYHIDHHGSSMYSDMDFYVVIALEYTMQAWDAECRESATG